MKLIKTMYHTYDQYSSYILNKYNYIRFYFIFNDLNNLF